MFAAGLLLLQMVIGREAMENLPLFTWLDSNSVSKIWRKVKAYDILTGHKNVLSKEFMDLIENLLHFDPTKRLSFEDVHQHIWMNITFQEDI